MCWACQATRDVRQPARPSSQGRCMCEWVRRPLGLCYKAAEPDATRAASWRTSQHQAHQRVLRDSSECGPRSRAGEGRGGEDRVSGTGLLDRAQLKRSMAG